MAKTPQTTNELAVGTAQRHRPARARAAPGRQPERPLAEPVRGVRNDRATGRPPALGAGRDRGHQPHPALAHRRQARGRPSSSRATPDSDDRRVAHVVSTAKGRRALRADPATSAPTRVSLAIDGLSDAERRALAAALPVLESLAETLRDAPRVIMDATVRRTFSALRDPQLPPLLHRPGDLADRHLDADDGAGVARARSSPTRRPTWAFVVALQTLPVLLLGPYGGLVADRVDKRRLMIVLQSLMGVQALVLATADADEPRDLRRRLHPRAPARPQQLLREPVPAGLRARDGRARRPAKRGQPQLDAGQRRARGRPGRRRRPDRDRRRGLVLSAERRQLRRRGRLADDDGPLDAGSRACPPPAPAASSARASATSPARPSSGFRW